MSEHDVEALAQITCADDHKNCGYASWADAPGGIREYHRGHARAVLASDWLARRDAAQRAEGAELGRRASLDPGAFVKRGPDYDGNEYGERLDHWQARAIAAAIARAGTAGGSDA